MEKRPAMPFTGILAKGYKVKQFQLLTKLPTGELAPTENETESYAVSLDDADATEGRTEIKAYLHGRGLTVD